MPVLLPVLVCVCLVDHVWYSDVVLWWLWVNFLKIYSPTLSRDQWNLDYLQECNLYVYLCFPVRLHWLSSHANAHPSTILHASLPFHPQSISNISHHLFIINWLLYPCLNLWLQLPHLIHCVPPQWTLHTPISVGTEGKQLFWGWCFHSPEKLPSVDL